MTTTPDPKPSQIAAVPPRLWHGTCETIDGALRPGGYDGLLWFADDPSIARAYIPESGCAMMWSPLSPWEMTEPVRPDLHGALWTLCRSLGFPDVEAERDALGDAKSWKGRTPRKAEVADRLAALGYDPAATQWLKESSGKILRADHRLKGSLHMVDATQLRLLDLREGDFDFMDPSYHRLADFKLAREAGFDGVAINDMVKDAEGDMIGHDSYGVFAHAAPRLKVRSVTAAVHARIRERNAA